MTLYFPDDSILAAQRAEMQAGFAAEHEITRITGKTALQRAKDDIEGEAKELRRTLVKRAARWYRDDPRLLDRIKIGLSHAHPVFIMATLEQMHRIPWGRIDMLAVLSVNEAGAYTYARWLRREMRKLAEPARPRAAIGFVATDGEYVG